MCTCLHLCNYSVYSDPFHSSIVAVSLSCFAWAMCYSYM